MAKVKRMFLGSNSSKGFYSLFEQIRSENLDRYFIIKGGPGTGKSVFMKRIGEHVESMDLNIEYYHCSSDCNSLDGVFVPELKVALVDGTAPHVVEPKYPVLIDEILDFAQFLDRDKLLPYRDDIFNISQEASLYFKRAYLYLKQAAIVFEECKISASWKYGSLTNKRITTEVIEEILKEVNMGNDTPKIRNFFASGITPQGICQYYDTLLTGDTKVYCLEGYLGIGAKKIMAKIVDTAYSLGLDMEIYHCPFMPDTIDMLIMPTINVAVINTAYPYHSDILKKAYNSHTIEIDNYQNEWEIGVDQITNLIDKAIDDIGKAKSAHDALENIYMEAMDFERIDTLYENILDIIQRKNVKE